MFLGSILSGIFSGFISPILTAWSNIKIQTLKNDVEGFKSAVGADTEVAKAYLDAQAENARVKAASNTWLGARIIILIAGLPAAIHFAAVMIDSTFRLGWAVPKCPPPYDGYEWSIIQSFFFVAPAMPVMSAVSAWLGRKK